MPQVFNTHGHWAHDEEVRDDCIRLVSIAVEEKEGTQEREIPTYALFNKSQSGNFMTLEFVEKNNLSFQVPCKTEEPLPEGIQVHGRIDCRWSGNDKRCSNKLIFLPPRFLKSSFLVVSSQSTLGPVTIGRDTITNERLDKDLLSKFR